LPEQGGDLGVSAPLGEREWLCPVRSTEICVRSFGEEVFDHVRRAGFCCRSKRCEASSSRQFTYIRAAVLNEESDGAELLGGIFIPLAHVSGDTHQCALFYRRVLAAWEFLLAVNDRPALARIRELTELERTPLPLAKKSGRD
jgi:hypothetical protein